MYSLPTRTSHVAHPSVSLPNSRPPLRLVTLLNANGQYKRKRLLAQPTPANRCSVIPTHLLHTVNSSPGPPAHEHCGQSIRYDSPASILHSLLHSAAHPKHGLPSSCCIRFLPQHIGNSSHRSPDENARSQVDSLHHLHPQSTHKLHRLCPQTTTSPAEKTRLMPQQPSRRQHSVLYFCASQSHVSWRIHIRPAQHACSTFAQSQQPTTHANFAPYNPTRLPCAPAGDLPTS